MAQIDYYAAQVNALLAKAGTSVQPATTGNLADLTTTNKDNLVTAINEVKAAAGGDYAERAEAAAAEAEEVLESIPEDYSDLSAEVSDLKSAIVEYNAYNFLAIHGTHTDGTYNGVTLTWLDKETCKLNNTATGNTNINIINTGSLPDYFEAGKSYSVKVSRTNTAVFLRVYYWVGATSTVVDFTGDGILSLPSGCTGIQILLRFANGSAFNNDTIKVIIENTKSNGALTEYANNLNKIIEEYNAYNILANYGNHKDTTDDGVSLVWLDNETCKLNNTATGNFSVAVIEYTTPLASYWEIGKTYQVKMRRTNSAAYLRIWFYVGGDSTYVDITADGSFTIPTGCTAVVVQIRANTGSVFNNDTFYAAILSRDVGGNTYNITNEYNTNHYSNSYTLEATPTITTDTNQYLAASGTSNDRAADIEALLTATGVCRLGPGEFYVTGVTLNEKQTLIGSGKSTKLILKDSVTNGFAVKMGSETTLKDLHIRGTQTVTVSSTVGTRHGILIEGNADGDNDDIPERIVIDGVYISRLNGGAITAYNTGLSIPAAILASNIHIWDCDAGVNISYFSEFNQFVNVTAKQCYYGCVDNGGNNIFSNCNFTGNKMGVLFDNTDNKSPNNTHGGFANCIFDHSDSNNGTGIKFINCHAGEVFTGCQVFYSKIEVINSSGVTFSNFNFGNGETITISGGGLVMFDHCMFGTAPTISITDNTHVIFDECYTRAGVAVTAS